jgi:hypothetical protein
MALGRNRRREETACKLYDRLLEIVRSRSGFNLRTNSIAAAKTFKVLSVMNLWGPREPVLLATYACVE